MLKVKIFCVDQSELVIDNIIAFGSNNKESKVVCIDHASDTFFIKTGKIYLLKSDGSNKSIISYHVSDGMVEVEDNLLKVFCLRFFKKGPIEYKIQDKLNDDLWNYFISQREKQMNQDSWIDEMPDAFINL
jgi:hypothetical protein